MSEGEKGGKVGAACSDSKAAFHLLAFFGGLATSRCDAGGWKVAMAPASIAFRPSTPRVVPQISFLFA